MRAIGAFAYEPEFLTQQDQSDLLEVIRTLPLEQARYRQWQAKRRVIAYGGRYDFTHHALYDAPPIPEFLHPLRAQVAAWAGIAPDDIRHAMIAEYPADSQLGWHRDVPDFEQIVGVSLLGQADNVSDAASLRAVERGRFGPEEAQRR